MPTLPAPVTQALLGIDEEALTNIHRHAQAMTADLILDTRTPGTLTLIVQDDGVGMLWPRPTLPVGAGAGHMQERARGLGGVVTIESTLGQGTVITVQLPVKEA